VRAEAKGPSCVALRLSFSTDHVHTDSSSPSSLPTHSHRIVGFEVRARSVDVSRYQGNPEDASDMSCTIKAVSNDAGGLVLSSKDSALIVMRVGLR
jgi:hypothetical protein